MFFAGLITGVCIVGFYLIGEACYQASEVKRRRNGDKPEERG